MDAGFEARLRVGGETVDRRDAELLRAVEQEGSLNAAADSLGRSYSRAHDRLSTLEGDLGALVERTRGGSGGGGSHLTDRGRAVLARFDRLAAALEGTASTEKVWLRGTVLERTGDLATVETPAGTVRALLDRDAEAVTITFRADAVVLHDPDGVPDEAATSARNRFRGTVMAIDRGEATATVEVDVGADRPLAVTITAESLATLDLSTGDAVVASVKATATRATPAVDGTAE